MANLITAIRILCSVVLIFLPVFSPAFYTVYCLAGFTDMIDGTIARKTNSVSEFGARLDTIADFFFVMVCLIKMLPALTIPVWLLIWIGVIGVIKIGNIIVGYFVKKQFVSEHTILNKVTGGALFLFVLTISVIPLTISGGMICALATLAAIQEGYYVICK